MIVYGDVDDDNEDDDAQPMTNTMMMVVGVMTMIIIIINFISIHQLHYQHKSNRYSMIDIYMDGWMNEEIDGLIDWLIVYIYKDRCIHESVHMR